MGSKGDVKEFFGTFSGAGFWTGWAWILLGFGCFGSVPNGGRSCHRRCHCSSIHSSIHYMVFAWFFHAFEAACLVMSGIGVGLLHLSCGRQKATLGSFSGAGFWTGWAWILLGFGCFGSVPNGGRSCHRSCHCSSIHSSIHYMVFAWFFHAFEAACLVMSGIGRTCWCSGVSEPDQSIVFYGFQRWRERVFWHAFCLACPASVRVFRNRTNSGVSEPYQSIVFYCPGASNNQK